MACSLDVLELQAGTAPAALTTTHNQRHRLIGKNPTLPA
jgi:hypothetical protein